MRQHRIWTVARSALVALVFAVSLSASATQVRGWEVEQNNDKCSMMTTFEDGVIFMFFWNPRLETHSLFIASDDWDSLRPRDEQTLKLTLNLRGNLEYDEWWDESAQIRIVGDDLEAIWASWGREHSDDFSASFALATAVTVEADGRTIGTYNLDGTYAAMLELVRCGARILKNGGDPFAK